MAPLDEFMGDCCDAGAGDCVVLGETGFMVLKVVP